MPRNLLALRLGLLVVAPFFLCATAAAQHEQEAGSRLPTGRTSQLICGPDDIYAKIPATDEFGRDQRAMFRAWNADPVGTHEANLRTIHPLLAGVVRKTQADNPNLPFVVGSGRRSSKLQRKAIAWGWSRTADSPHRSGVAVDLWPLDPAGHVHFDTTTQNRIAAAVRKAAADLGVPIRWGGHFHGFKDRDRSHFELAPP
jgi:cell wall-associated NlpC family hydrolase